MEDQKRVECPENQALSEYMWKKMQEMTQNPKGLSEIRQMILHRAYYSVCYSKISIETIEEFSHIKGVGKWIIGLMQGFFSNSSGSPEHEDFLEKGGLQVGSNSCVNRSLLMKPKLVGFQGLQLRQKKEKVNQGNLGVLQGTGTVDGVA
ncbi:Crossover junction endonuclease mus81 [Ancistrocladus abbreviatus]